VSATRVEHILGRHARRTIASGADDEGYATVIDAALYLATAGFLERANALLTRLWSYGWPHTRHVWLQDRAMQVLWHAAGQRPTFIPFELEPIDRLELDHRIYVARDKWLSPIPSRSWQELSGTDLLRRSTDLACPASENGPMPAGADELEALLGLEKYIATFFDPPGLNFAWTFPVATCLAAELAARNGRTDAVRLARL